MCADTQPEHDRRCPRCLCSYSAAARDEEQDRSSLGRPIPLLILGFGAPGRRSLATELIRQVRPAMAACGHVSLSAQLSGAGSSEMAGWLAPPHGCASWPRWDGSMAWASWPHRHVYTRRGAPELARLASSPNLQIISSRRQISEEFGAYFPVLGIAGGFWRLGGPACACAGQAPHQPGTLMRRSALAGSSGAAPPSPQTMPAASARTSRCHMSLQSRRGSAMRA